MAGKGPLPKPADRRQRRNKPSTVVPLPGTAHELVADPPSPPRGLLPATRQDWKDFWGSEVAPLVKTEHLPALRRLFKMRDERARYDVMIDKRPVVDGSMGQPVMNPLMRQRDALDAKIRDLEDRFFMSPAARLRAPVGNSAATGLEQIWRQAMEDHGDEDSPADPRRAAVELPARNR